MLTTVSGTPKEEGISQSSPEIRTLSPSAATVAALMAKSSREGASSNPDLLTSLLQPHPSSMPLDLNSIFKNLFQHMNNNTNTIGPTTTAAVSNTNSFSSATTTTNNRSGNNDGHLSTFNRAQCAMPTVLANMGLTNPLVLSPNAVTTPEPCQVSPANQVTTTANGQSSPGQIPFPPHSFSPLNYPVMPSVLLANTPISASQSPVNSRLESPLTNRPQNNNTLASIANITSVLSPSLSNVGAGQFLAACTPLLQLAVRQAIIDCISTCGKVSVQGQLEVTVTGTANNQATVVLKFDDKTTHSGQPSPQAGQVTSPLGDHRCSPQSQIGSIFQTAELNDDNDRTLLDGEGRKLSMTSQCSTGSSSRRKPLNPSKCRFTIANNVSESLSPSVTLPAESNGCIISPSLLINHSSPTSPSTDSGVLDLSRSTSFVESAPITPMKGLRLSTESNVPLPLISDVNKKNVMLEAYQTLTSLQAAMLSKTNNTHDINNTPVGHTTVQTSENNHNPLSLNFYHLAQQMQQQHLNSSFPTLHQQLAHSFLPNGATSQPSLPIGQPTSNGVTSAPNSPVVKGVRRQRLPIGTARGPACRVPIMRRSTSSRRFPCNQCRDEFTSLHSLEEHTVTKHGSYRCHVCQAQFTQRSNLQRHALKHVGFKPFECRVCSKAYYRKDHLMRHMEMGHPGFAPRDNITVHLTSSESLEFLNRTCTNGSFVSNSSAGLAYTGDSEMDCPMFDSNNGMIEDEFDNTIVPPTQTPSYTSPHNDSRNALDIPVNDVLKEDNNSCVGSLYQTNSDGRCASNDGDQSMSNAEDADLGRSPQDHDFSK